MTQVNRNKLSEFEKGKATLSATEKRLLTKFYEDRGYDFGDPDEVDVNQIGDTYTEAHQALVETVQNVMPNDVGEALIQLADARHDVMACAEYLSAFNDNNAQKDTRPAICQQLDAELLAHFKDDAEGKFNNKESLLFVSTRGHSLAGILAYSKLCELAQHTDTIALSLRQASKKSDNYRLLDTLETLLDNNELPEFKHMDAKRVK